MEGRDQPEGSLREEARVRTQSRVALPPNLKRVNAAARQAAQPGSRLYCTISMKPLCFGRFDDRSGKPARGSMG
ncbi:hypothetical protein ABIA45_007495 [Bradyrhizobium sp. USDA 336]